MKAKILNPETFPQCSHKETSPYIRLHNQGEITISSGACSLIGLKDGDGVSFIQDQDELKDWYILASERGYKVRGEDKKSKNMNHQVVRCEIIKSSKLDFSAVSIKLKVANKPTEIDGVRAYAVLTVSGK